jgi:hypothetical protein
MWCNRDSLIVPSCTLLVLSQSWSWLRLRGQRPYRIRFQLDIARPGSLDHGTPRNGVIRL